MKTNSKKFSTAEITGSDGTVGIVAGDNILWETQCSQRGITSVRRAAEHEEVMAAIHPAPKPTKERKPRTLPMA